MGPDGANWFATLQAITSAISIAAVLVGGGVVLQQLRSVVAAVDDLKEDVEKVSNRVSRHIEDRAIHPDAHDMSSRISSLESRRRP